MQVRAMYPSVPSGREARSEKPSQEGKRSAVQPGHMPGVQAPPQVLELQALDKGPVLCRWEDAGHQGSLRPQVHGEGGGLPDMGDRPYVLEKAALR